MEKLLSALDVLGIEDFRGVRIPIKLHMGEPKVFEEVNQVDPSKQVQYAQEIGFSDSYEIVRL